MTTASAEKRPRGNPKWRKGVSANPGGNPKWVKGVSGNPAGRRAENKVSKYTEAQLQQIASRYGITPLEFMVSCIRDQNLPLAFRLDAAVAAAPYMHRRMPIGVDNRQGGPIGFYSAEQLAKLTDEQLNQLHKAVAILALGPQPLPIDVTPKTAP